MPQPIVYVDTSDVRPGKLDELEKSMDGLASFVDSHMPQLLEYGFYLDESRTRMTVVAVHPDSASLEHHLEVGAAEFRGFADLIELQSIDVYGSVSDTALEGLQAKAAVLGPATVRIHTLAAGFSRVGAA